MGLSTGEYTLTVKGGDITAFSDYSGTVSGTVKVTSAYHGLSSGDYITISGTTNYNLSLGHVLSGDTAYANNLVKGVTVIDADNFYYYDAFVVDDATGNWVALNPLHKIIINDIEIILGYAASFVSVTANIATNKNTCATNIAALISGAFSQVNTGSSVTATAGSDIITITGARRVKNISSAISAGNGNSGSRTAQDIVNEALSINTISTEDEPPSTSDIFQFIKDGQYDLINKLHENAFIKDDTGLTSGMIRLVDFTNTSFVDKKQVDLGSITHYNGSSNYPVAILKVLELSYKSSTKDFTTMTESDTKSRAEKVPFDLLQDIRDGNHSFYKAEDYTDSTPIPKFYSVLGNVLELSHPLSSTTSTQNLSVLALCKPNELLTSECSFGEHLQELLVMYAKAKSYELLNRADLSVKIMSDYNQIIGVVNLKHSSKETFKFEREIPK